MGSACQWFWAFSIQCWLIVSCETESSAKNGVLYAESLGTSRAESFCVTFDPGFHKFPEHRQDAERLPLKDLTSPGYQWLCHAPAGQLPTTNGSAIAALRGNCTVTEKARVAQALGSRALIVVSPELVYLRANSSSDYADINITVAVIAADSFQEIQDLGSNITIQLYAPVSSPVVDPNLLVIWLLAVVTIAIGSFWSGRVRYHLWLSKLSSLPGSRHQSADVEFTPISVLIIVVLMCAMLLGLYFFFRYLVYVIIGLFMTASALALYDCLSTIFHLLPCFECIRCRMPPNRLPWLQQRPTFVDILLLFVSLGVSILWFLIRHQTYAWVLQDFLGIMFCIQMMKVIRLPNFKICVILLSLLFFYDIFFVFITPLFTKNGHSIMIDVATGGGSGGGEMLPMVLIVPRFLKPDTSVCMVPYSLLGFGDILVPGLLVSFCYGFDLQVKSRSIYFFSALLAYGIGLVLTFLGLMIMHGGQPALLYLVPCTLLTTVVIGWQRKELKQLWTGNPKRLEEPSVSDVTSSITQSIDSHLYPADADTTVQSTTEEQERLINKMS